MSNNTSNSEITGLLKWYAQIFAVLSAISLTAYGFSFLLPVEMVATYKSIFIGALSEQKFYIFIVVGFLAQMIDSSLGMAYGVSSSTFLIATGVPPKLVSSTIVVSQIVNNAVSALSHLRLGNIDKKLFWSLVIPGVIGAFIGASLLTQFDGTKIKPFISMYLLGMGIYIIRKAFKKKTVPPLKHSKKRFQGERFVALTGGFVTSMTGGGWGPIVTSTLIGIGKDPRKAIGSVNSAKYFVILVASIVFLLKIDNLLDMFVNIFGLVIGGVIAAPLGAYITKYIPIKPAIVLVGSIIIALSTYSLYTIFLV